MASSIDDNYNDLSAFLDDELVDLDGFDFILEEDGADAEPFPLLAASGSGDNNFDGLLADSIESAGMDFQFETPEVCDAAEQKLNKISMPVCSVDCQSRRRGKKRDRSPSPRPHQKKCFQMNTVNFDPPVTKQQRATHPRRVSYSDLSIRPPAQQLQQQQQQEHSTHPRQVSYNDLSMCSTRRSSAPSSATVTANQQVFELVNIQQHSYVAKCIEALQLQKLVESMKRTEMTRRRVMMHRSIMLRPEHQRALMGYQTQQVQQQQSSSKAMTSFFNDSARGSFAKNMEQSRKNVGMSMIVPEHPHRALYPAKKRLDQQTRQVQLDQQIQQSPSAATASFFDHSARGSFAEKMRQSRKKIAMYMAQINQKTLQG